MHSKGICHRDLKPWNIMLSDDLLDAKVIDFSYSTPLKKKRFVRMSEATLGIFRWNPIILAPRVFG